MPETGSFDVAAHDNGWRRRTFRVLVDDGSLRIPGLTQVSAEEGARIDEFYDNLFDTIPEACDESATLLCERFDSSPQLLKGITLQRVLKYTEERYFREISKLLSGDPQMNFEAQLETAFNCLRLKELSDFVTGGMSSNP